MIHKKRNLLFTILLIIFIQILLYINNNQKTSFRYFIWKINEVSIGKLITISFMSGLLISSILNKSTNINIQKDFLKEEKIEDDLNEVRNEDELKKNVEMPPQRDIRDTQPTISVNYRVIKNTKDDYPSYGEPYSKDSNSIEDWNNDESDW